ncbi:MAG: HAMP domain-containing histidine kinase [Phycisphaerae bacterium]|nr:HAMP domain-containing histidine kinase [Phycisphaerae bacterium]
MNSLLNQRQSIHLQLQENQQKIDELEKQLIAVQKLAAMGTMTYVIAHEFNGLLVPIINHCELIQKYPDDKDLAIKSLNKILKNSQQAAKVVHNVLNLANDVNRDGQKETVILLNLINDCFDCIVRELHKDRINVKLNISKKATINVIRSEFQQVLLNLIINARQAMLGQGGTLNFTLSQSDDKQYDIIEISDTGSGIKKDDIEHIFDPFFSTKTNNTDPDTMGTGLGLMVCKNIIEKHQGKISVKSEYRNGTTFTINIPK